jgi:multidrug transporter EmrE-like cation transporter
MSLVSLSLILLGVLLNAGGQLLLKAGTNAVGEFEFTSANAIPIGMKLLLQPPILLGFVCYFVSVLVWIMALSRVPVSIAYPMLSIGYVINAFAAWYLFGESVTAQRWFGIGFIAIGVWLIARS